MNQVTEELRPVQQLRKHSLVNRTLRDSGYILAALPFAIASFIVIITGVCLGAGMAIIWIGLPIGVATLYAGRGFANMERLRLHKQGTIIEGVPALPQTSTAWWARALRPLKDPGLWREALHGILIFPISVFTWSVTLTWWALVLSGFTGWIWEPLSGYYSGAGQLMRLLHWPIPGWVFDLIIGVFALVTLPWVVRGCAFMHVGLAKAFLAPSKESLAQRVAYLSEARDQLGRAETSALRRMERDLHDGPQQTLIRLGMDLAATQRRLDEGDIESGTALLDGARHMTDSVIADLRSLSRSIAPPILTERGLGPALLAAAATCTIPVLVNYDFPSEPPEKVATAAYFVACEALANAVKHSEATRITVLVTTDDNNDLLLEIHDNGTGGAQSIPGHGLAGLQDRISGLDGHLTINGTSGTTITAVLPM
ncbi:MAG: sensor domain-containing protein [Propionibacteriaceae bacterium]|nr:sensor domain-containing protein [Propionibacteriaceae bacterium]